MPCICASRGLGRQPLLKLHGQRGRLAERLLPQLEPTQDYELTLGVRLFAAPTTAGPPQPRAAAAGEAWPPDRQS